MSRRRNDIFRHSEVGKILEHLGNFEHGQLELSEGHSGRVSQRRDYTDLVSEGKDFILAMGYCVATEDCKTGHLGLL